MSRKPIDADKIRNTNINLKVTREEKEAIDQVARILGIPVSAAIRNVTLSSVKKIKKTEVQEACSNNLDNGGLTWQRNL